MSTNLDKILLLFIQYNCDKGFFTRLLLKCLLFDLRISPFLESWIVQSNHNERVFERSSQIGSNSNRIFSVNTDYFITTNRIQGVIMEVCENESCLTTIVHLMIYVVVYGFKNKEEIIFQNNFN
jgi:hypothetical protein